MQDQVVLTPMQSWTHVRTLGISFHGVNILLRTAEKKCGGGGEGAVGEGTPEYRSGYSCHGKQFANVILFRTREFLVISC